MSAGVFEQYHSARMLNADFKKTQNQVFFVTQSTSPKLNFCRTTDGTHRTY